MKNTIEITPKSTKWILIINGTINSFLGTSQLLQSGFGVTWQAILGVILIVSGPLMIGYGILLFFTSNKLVPRVQIDKNGILVKEDLYKASKKIAWENIKEITYRPFELNFKLSNDATETVLLNTSPDVSIEIKKNLRKFAEDKAINVIGG